MRLKFQETSERFHNINKITYIQQNDWRFWQIVVVETHEEFPTLTLIESLTSTSIYESGSEYSRANIVQKMQLKLIFIGRVLHKDSFWNRGTS